MRSRVLVVLVLLILQSCYPMHDLEQNSLRMIRTIAVTDFSGPSNYLIFSYADCSLGSSSSGRIRTDGSDFAKAMAAQGLHLEQDLRAAVVTALRSDGYQVVPLHATRQSASLEGVSLVRPADVTDVNADAVLDVSVNAALYSNNFFGGAFYPQANLDVELFNAKTKAMLLAKRINYLQGDPGLLRPPIFVPDEQYKFTKCESLLTDPARAAAGLRAVAPMLGDYIRTSLAR